MARSLTIKNSNGSNTKTVSSKNMDAIYNVTLGNNDIQPQEYYIVVDKQPTNASFTIEGETKEWLHYKIERFGYDDGYVKLIIQVDKNLDTLGRSYKLRITHNCIPITITMDIWQEGTVYEIETSVNSLFFEPISVEKYEEKKVTITAIGGNEEWSLKTIEQYACSTNDVKIAIPFDNSLTYNIENNVLNIRSYGKIDLLPSESYMEYHFIIRHNGITETNKDYNGVSSNGEINTNYEKKIIVRYS